MKKSEIKTIKDVDIYRKENALNGQIESRYRTLVKLYGERNADRIVRELEARSW